MTGTAPRGETLQRILVATDLSARSDRALRRATLIAKRVGASLTLVHVLDGEQPSRMIEIERAEASLVLEETVGVASAADGVRADYRIAIDDPFRGILAAADEIDADLVILGPHRGRFRDIFTGTTVERVVRLGNRSLLVAVQPPEISYERTLLALDFDASSKAAADGALRMGLFDRTAVTVMHAFDAPAAGMMQRSLQEPDAVDDYIGDLRTVAAERLRQFAAALGLPASPHRIVMLDGSPSRTILDAAHDQRSDLVVLGTSKRSGVSRLLIGSVTEQVLRDAERDILIIPVDGDSDGEQRPDAG